MDGFREKEMRKMTARQKQRDRENPEDRTRVPEDAGRTVADMSGIEGPALFRMRRPQAAQDPALQGGQRGAGSSREESGDSRPDRPWEQSDVMTPQERRMYALGALKAALLIGMAFILGLGAVILVMILAWT